MKTKFALATATIAFALFGAGAAQAEVFTYVDTVGNTMTIDNTAGTGSITGPHMNATFYGSDLKNFQGGALPTGHYNILFNSGSTATAGYQYGTGAYIAPNGTTYVPNNTHQPMLEFNGTSAFNIWAVWGTTSNPGAIVLGDYYWTNTGYNPPSASSSGGCTTGGCPSSSGGTTTSTSTGGTTTSTTSGGTTTSTTSGGTTTSTTSGGTTSGGTTSGGTTSGGTTSGGSTSGGSTSGGGTDVPAPGILGLMALAGIGIGAARRRRRA